MRVVVVGVVLVVAAVDAELEVRVVNDIGPPTSMGESVFREFEGLLLGLRGVLVPGDGDPALIEPTD